MHTMVLLSDHPSERLSAAKIASLIRVSEHHLSKVLQRLAKAGLVRGVRGPRGGFALAKKPNQITLLEVYEAIDGPLAPDDCLMRRRVCGARQCILGGTIRTVNERVKRYLTRTTLSKLKGTYSKEGGR
jgi:Rrf2 family protein